MTTPPLPPSVGPEAADRVHFTDPRVNALARSLHARSTGGDYNLLPWDDKHAFRTAARDWLRAAVDIGLLPLVVPSTGEALAAVALDVRPGDGRPRVGSRGRAQAFRDAADAIRPGTFPLDGPLRRDAWEAARERLLAMAGEEEKSCGDFLTADQLHAALVRIETLANDLDATARARRGPDATHPVADAIRGLIDGSRHGEDPM
ncbi:hypothetical protein ACH4Q7_22485 [Streptomyces roseolus]|uniref:hypothetical protein n=1 Tax=Streptomyces roseolus TaxID=67358 RepID=UPI00379CABAB